MDSGSISPLLLTVVYWLHMLATVVWIGGLAALSLLVIPSARSSLDAGSFSSLLLPIQRRLQNIGWFSLAVLGLTGMFQMSANPRYTGFLDIGSDWAAAILLKHLVIGLMVLTSGYMTWGVLPGLQRSAFLRAAGKGNSSDLQRLEKRENWLIQLNLLLSVIVLLLTAWARSVN